MLSMIYKVRTNVRFLIFGTVLLAIVEAGSLISSVRTNGVADVSNNSDSLLLSFGLPQEVSSAYYSVQVAFNQFSICCDCISVK